MNVSFKNILALTVTILIFGLIYMQYFYVAPPENRDSIKTSMDILVSGGFLYLLKYFYPSTEQSEKKTDTIQAQGETIKNLSQKSPPTS